MRDTDRPDRLYPEPLPSQYGGIRTKTPSRAYDEGYARTFGKKKRRPRDRKPTKRRRGG
jgi:energy-converting hydrogenase Eha subunit F